MTKKKTTTAAEKRAVTLRENLYRTTLEYVKGRKFKPASFDALSKSLNIHEGHTPLFQEVLERIAKEGHLQLQGDQYHTETVKEPVTGKIKVHTRGFGFVEPDDGTDDIFIPKPFTNGALDLDTVTVEITGVDDRGPEGRVLSVLARGRNQVAATILYGADGKYELFSTSFGDKQTINATSEEMKFKPGDRVLVEITEWGSKNKRPQGIITKHIGSINDPSSDIPFAIEDMQIRAVFPKKVLEEAKIFGERVSTKDIEGRVDLRELLCFTIDPDTAKDFDDAVSLEKRKGGGYRLGVHIADVSHYVREGSQLDEEARKRCNSTYFPGLCVPMLPHELSSNLCSLREGVNRLTVSVFIDLAQDGALQKWEIVRSVIKSKKRLTYRQAKEILDGKKKSALKPILDEMVEVAHLLQQKRSERGSVQLFMPDLVIKVDPNGVPTGTEIVEYDITHQLIEEFMLKANEVVAIHLSQLGKSVSFRVHEEPASENLSDFATLVEAFGFTLNKKPTPFDIQKFFLDIEKSPHAQYLATCYIKSMRLATYSPDNIGHYGLSLEHYCHFTSPIRRYVDTIIHRLLFSDNIDRNQVLEISKRASEQERLSAKAEMTVVQLKKLRYLEVIKKEGKLTSFNAIVTRVKPFGVFFDVVDYMLEGFVHISELGEDYYVYYEATSKLIGRHTNETFTSGQRIVVELQTIDLLRAQVSWSIIS